MQPFFLCNTSQLWTNCILLKIVASAALLIEKNFAFGYHSRIIRDGFITTLFFT